MSDKIDDETFVSCASCIHCIPRTSFFGFIKEYEFAKCSKSFKGSVFRDKVTGKMLDTREYKYCSTERTWSGDNKECGPDGKLWEPKDKTDLFKVVIRATNGIKNE